MLPELYGAKDHFCGAETSKRSYHYTHPAAYLLRCGQYKALLMSYNFDQT
jgi:hypothetical protein